MASMTRKHSELIAKSLKAGTEFAIYKDSPIARSQHNMMCVEIALDLRTQNDNFNMKRFLLACGLTVEAIEAL